ncbi:MAG: 3'-5' exonuclease [Cytophagales bacterium]|nr:3'-5' exonuclease [Cytophagales bacterium]
MKLQLRKPLVCFDLETTGLNQTTDRIVELCFIKITPHGEKSVLTQRLNPGIAISDESYRIHGISNEDVINCPTFHEVAKKLADFLEGCDLCGFNMLKFDLPVLVEEFLRANIDFKVNNKNLVDVQKIYHLMEPRNLRAAYKYYCDKNLDNAHSAEADTTATLEVLEQQIVKYQNTTIKNDKGEDYLPIVNDMTSLSKLTLTNFVDLAGRFVYNDKGEETINFGKHKDRTISWVLKTEPQYYDWFMKAEFPLESKRKFTEIKIREMQKK